jgi:TPR repeat protein
MISATLKQSLRRVALGVASMIILVVPMFAANKATEQCSVAVVASGLADARVCDLRLVRSMASGGNRFEQNQMGIASVLKISPELSTEDAVRWFEKSAQKGYAPAEVNLGVMYLNGWGVGRNYGAALRWFREAADQGFARAYYNLGILYMNGQGVHQDYEAARQYFEKGANAGDTSAQTNLGYLYDRGLGMPQNPKLALKWYRKAAEGGNPLAQHNLGDLYLRGDGVEQDNALALEWFKKAAAQGQTGAEIKLGYMLAEGRGTAKDPETAYSWIQAAYRAGDNRGQDLMRSLESRLSSQQLQRAKERAEKLRAESEVQVTAKAFLP